MVIGPSRVALSCSWPQYSLIFTGEAAHGPPVDLCSSMTRTALGAARIKGFGHCFFLVAEQGKWLKCVVGFLLWRMNIRLHP